MLLLQLVRGIEQMKYLRVKPMSSRVLEGPEQSKHRFQVKMNKCDLPDLVPGISEPFNLWELKQMNVQKVFI